MTANRQCHYCGNPLQNDYIRTGEKFFCPITESLTGFQANCFSKWVEEVYPERLATAILGEVCNHQRLTERIANAASRQ